MTATPAPAGLDELDALLAAATPGEWAVYFGDKIGSGVKRMPGGGVQVDWAVCEFDDWRDGDGNKPPVADIEADAALIVALRNRAPAMLAAIRAAYALAEEMEDAADMNDETFRSLRSEGLRARHSGLRDADRANAARLRAALDEALGGGK